MAAHRIYLPHIEAARARAGDQIEIDGDEAHHALAVKRLGVSAAITLINGRGLLAGAVIRSIARRRLTVELTTVEEVARPAPEIRIAAPPPKGPRAEAMIEQLSQIGVSLWLPLMTERSVVEPRDRRLARWRSATVIESAKQSGRAWLMEIADPIDLKTCVEQTPGTTRLLADPQGASGAEAFADWDRLEPVLLLVGPEGGFTEEEIRFLREAGAAPVRLGPHLMRVETAAVVGGAMLVSAGGA